MTLTSNRYRHAVLLTVLGTTIAWGTRASGQESDPVQKVVELNKKALAAFADLNMDEAIGLLKQALELCETAKLDVHPAAARTHVHLGAVYVAGLKQRDQGMEEFKKALRIDPKIKVTKSLLNPEVQSAFAEASMDVSEGAEGAEAAPAAPPPASPAVEPTEPVEPAQPNQPVPPAAAAESTIVHTPTTQGATGQPLEIRAQVPASVGAERVVLAYRPYGAPDFVTREMDSVDNSDWYQTQIPPDATGGASVAYYIVAQNAQGQTLEQNGTAAQPHMVTLGGESKGAGVSNGAGSEEEPASAGNAGNEASAAPFLWLALAAGSGGGYHSGTPEANHTDDNGNKLKASGLGWARLVQVVPEVGFFVSDSLVLSLQGRIQFVQGASQIKFSDPAKDKVACNGGTCQPSHYALAGLAKLTWFLGEPGRVSPFLSFAAGAGQIRHVVSVGHLDGCPASGCEDTVVGGPVLLGPGGGITVELSDSFSLLAGANLLMGVPKLMANVDVNFGVVYLR